MSSHMQSLSALTLKKETKAKGDKQSAATGTAKLNSRFEPPMSGEIFFATLLRTMLRNTAKNRHTPPTLVSVAGSY
jgi:hypothetical protein